MRTFDPPPPIAPPPPGGVGEDNGGGSAPRTRLIRLSRRVRAAAVVAVLGSIVALASGSGGLGSTRQGSADGRLLIRNVAIGMVSGAILGLVAVALLSLVARRNASLRRLLYGDSEPRFRLALRRAVPTLALLAGLGALIAASLTPLRTQSSDLPREQPTGKARVTDRNGDGEAEYEIDTTGNGSYESYYVPCEYPEGVTPPVPEPDASLGDGKEVVDGKERIAVDTKCDGTIDYYVEVERTSNEAPETAPGYEIDENGNVSRTSEAPASKEQKEPSTWKLPAWIAWLVAGLLVGALLAALVWGFLKRAPKPPKDDTGEQSAIDTVQLDRGVAASVDLVETDPDPRRAIIAAYGRLLEGLAAAGLPRRPEEGPEEYLARGLAALPIDPVPYQTLTRLFSEARFSTHPLSERHRQEALDALGRVRVELARLQQPAAAGAAR